MGSLQLANGYASVRTSLAIARARAQEMRKTENETLFSLIYPRGRWRTDHSDLDAVSMANPINLNPQSANPVCVSLPRTAFVPLLIVSLAVLSSLFSISSSKLPYASWASFDPRLCHSSSLTTQPYWSLKSVYILCRQRRRYLPPSSSRSSTPPSCCLRSCPPTSSIHCQSFFPGSVRWPSNSVYTIP